MEEMKAQAEHVGTRMIWDTIVSVDLENGPPFRAIGDSGDEYIGETLVICTGAQAKWLGAPGEMELGGKGVSACATCDGVLLSQQKGRSDRGGNTAVEEALYLTNHSDDVPLIHRPRQPAGPRRSCKNDCSAIRRLPCCGTRRWKASRRATTAMLHHLALKDTGDRRGLHYRSRRGLCRHRPRRPRPNCSRASCPMDDSGYLLTEPGTPKTVIPGVFCGGRRDRSRLSAGGDRSGDGLHGRA